MIEHFEKGGFWIFVCLATAIIGILLILWFIKKQRMNIKTKYGSIESDPKQFKRSTDILHKNQVKVIIFSIKELEEQIGVLQRNKNITYLVEVDTLIEKCHEFAANYTYENLITYYKKKNITILGNIRKSYPYIHVMDCIYKADKKNVPMIKYDVDKNGFHLMSDEEYAKYKESHIYNIMLNTINVFRENFDPVLIGTPDLDLEEIFKPTGYIYMAFNKACDVFYDNIRTFSLSAYQKIKAIQDEIERLEKLEDI